VPSACSTRSVYVQRMLAEYAISSWTVACSHVDVVVHYFNQVEFLLIICT